MIDKSKGKVHKDERGTLIHFNDFDMNQIKRFYIIEPSDSSVIRAWQGHRIETKWFFCIKGKFLLKVFTPDDWKEPTSNSEFYSYVLNEDDPVVIKVSGGNVNGFQALESDSMLIVYSDVSLEESKKDDYRFSLSQLNWEK